MDVTYRPAGFGDLETAVDVVVQAITDLRLRHGFARTMTASPPLFQRFCLAEGADGVWVAEGEGTILGFAMSWMCDQFWYLSELFIRPDMQAKGVGQCLLSKTIEQAQRKDAKNRALITFAYNTKATGLYVRNGFYPREPLYFMAAPASVVGEKLTHNSYDVSPIASLLHSRELIGQIDEAVLGFRRDAHHGFLLEGSAVLAVQIWHGGGAAGYAYISRSGHIGPLAVAPEADPKGVVEAAIRCALQERPEQVSMIVPGSADRILATVSELGLRIVEPFVLLSARPFGNWRCYLPSDPGYL